ncbi:MAG: hypothetical protein FWD12_11825 [Alphaproteobacteria bacterium]|nr:hypothetical protein [Alphaproteobacteria bacterium]
MRMPSDLERIVKAGQAAWKRLKSEKSWNDWMAVGEALMVGREEAMDDAGIPLKSNRPPQGRVYNTAFGEWLRKNKLDDMDKGDRSRLFEVMENRGAVEEWRKTLSPAERVKLNHPSTVLRNWKAADALPKTPKPKPEKEIDRAYDEVRRLQEELDRKNHHIEELEAARGRESQDRQTFADLAEKLEPFLEGLHAQGKSNMTTMSPASVAHAASQLERLLFAYDVIPETKRIKAHRKRFEAGNRKLGVSDADMDEVVDRELRRK